MVDFSQTTEPFTALMSLYTDRSVWNPLGVLRWEGKKKEAPLRWNMLRAFLPSAQERSVKKSAVWKVAV